MGDLDRVIACLNEMGFKPKLSSFEDKIIAQKATYLLKKMGVDLGYTFGLYVRGPYSPDLTRDMYANPQKLVSAPRVNLTENERNAARLLGELDMRPAFFEIASTYAYLAIDMQLPEDRALSELRRIKPFFSEADRAVGVSKAKMLLFRPSDEAMKGMREEMAAWDAASDEALSKAG